MAPRTEVAPRYATPRPAGPSHGRRVAALSAALGRPFMPWQHLVSDRLNVYGADGLRTTPLMLVTVQRQSGKTTWVKAEVVERCLFGPPEQRVWYTAQTGQYSRDQWATVAKELCSGPLSGYVAAKWTNGSECLTFPNGSTFRPFPPTRDALHGVQSDLVVIDEPWRHDALRGAEIMQAVGPTQATRPGAQIVLVSTMGTAASTFLHPMVDRGRAGEIAYVEYGIGPQGDPTDLDAVIAAHPAVGHTIDADFIRGQAAVLSPSEFARAYGNVATSSESRYITVGQWDISATLDPVPAHAPAVLGVAVAIDQSRSALVACVGGVAEVIASDAGVDWVPAAVRAAVAAGIGEVWIASKGPSAVVWDRLAGDYPPHWLHDAGPVLTVAPAWLMDELGRSVRHRRHPNLDQAADAAYPRFVGDGGWTWGRRASGGPIPEIEAMTWAVWGDAHRPVVVRPRIITV